MNPPISSKNIIFSSHAKERMQQRGISLEAANAVLRYADNSSYVKDGRSLWVSKLEAKRLRHEGELRPSMVDKVRSIYVIVSNDNNALEVITVMHQYDNNRWRHYRKNVKLRKSRKARSKRR